MDFENAIPVMLLDDFEENIPVSNLQLDSSKLTIKTVSSDDQGFTETKIERLKLQNNEEARQVCIARPLQRPRQVSNTIVLSIEDLKMAKNDNDCWKVYDCYFRRVLIYGKVDVTNHFSKDHGSSYRFLFDDGSENIIGTMRITKEQKTLISNQHGRLTLNKNRVKQMLGTGINIKGNFLPPESDECKKILKNMAIVNCMTKKNLEHQAKHFPLGPMPQKALIFGFPYEIKEGDVQLHVIDLTLNDKMELSWKQQLNRIYKRVYLKNK